MRRQLVKCKGCGKQADISAEPFHNRHHKCSNCNNPQYEIVRSYDDLGHTPGYRSTP